MIELLGWIGAIFFAICMIPQTLHAIKTKKSGMTLSTLLIYTWGLITMLVYTPLALDWNAPLMANYSVNLICSLILLYYRITSKK